MMKENNNLPVENLTFIGDYDELDNVTSNVLYINFNVSDSFNITDAGSTSPTIAGPAGTVHCPPVYQEPHPEWKESLHQWGCVFPLHYYTFSIGFLLTVVILLISTLTVHETGRKSMVLLNAFLLIAGLCRGLALLIDPYGSMDVLPQIFLGILSMIVKPCLTSSFCLILWTFLNIAQVKIGWCGVPKEHVAYWVILGHFTITMCVHLLVIGFPRVRLLLVLSEATFIIWGMCLCAIFVIKTFRITQFTSETKRAYKELSDYNLSKNEHGMASKRLKRVKRPKIRMERTDSYSALEDSSENSDSTDEDVHIKENKAVTKTEPKSQLEVVMLNETLTVMQTDFMHGAKNKSKFMDADVTDRGSDSESGSVFTADDFPHTCDRPVHCHERQGDDDDEEHEYQHQKIPNNNPETVVELVPLPRDSIFEQGYLGDSEHGSPYKKRMKTDSSFEVNRERSCSDAQKDFRMMPRDTSTYISYRRLRQGRCLHKVVKLSHVTVTSLFLLCILHLYSMFGVYGILSKQTTIQPWPWLAFQTCLRTGELLMCVTMTYAAICLTSNRRHKDLRRKRKSNTIRNEAV